MVKKLELAVSTGFTSKPQHSSPSQIPPHPCQRPVQTGVKGNKRAGHIGDTLVSKIYVHQSS